MTSQEKDRFIAEGFGLVWHDPKWHADKRMWRCPCGVWTTEIRLPPCLSSNPNFTSEAGRIALLKLMTDKDDFWYQEEQYLDLELFMLDDDGKFRDEVFWWMGGVE